MTVGWFIANYKRRANRIDGDGSIHAVRYCAMDDYHDLILGSSALQNPIYTYNTAGAHRITLNVRGDPSGKAFGAAVLVLSGTGDVQISPIDVARSDVNAPIVNFTVSLILPLTVQFTDLSSGSISAYHWEFGDGWYEETEVLGNVAIVKVRALSTTLSAIAADANVTRLPKDMLTTSLSDLTTNQKNAIVNKLQNMGYSLTEIRDRLGNDIGSLTLGDVLRFAATRRLKPRYDQNTDTIILDGVQIAPRSVDDVDSAVL